MSVSHDVMPERLTVGMHVAHPEHGRGTVKTILGRKASVEFDSGQAAIFDVEDHLLPPSPEGKSYEEQLDYDVARRARELKINELARARLQAEKAFADQAPFDAGLLDEILARPQEPAHRAEGLIPANAGTLVVAQRKTGKTTLLLNLARCLIDGGAFLGRFDVTPVTGRVAFLNFEVSAAQLARWADEVGVAHDRLFLVNLRGRRNPLGNPHDRELLAGQLRELEVESLIVDPFGRAYTGASQNDAGDVGNWLADLDRFARGDVGARDLVLAAHAGWSGERSRGSTALEDWADSIVTLTKDDDQTRYLRAEGRDISVEEDALAFDPHARTLTLAGSGSRKTTAKVKHLESLLQPVAELLAETPAMSGNQIDSALRDSELDVKFTKGDGTRAAQILEKRGLVASKAGPRNARLFTLTTSPTSLNFPEGGQATSPTSLYRGRSPKGTQTANTTEGTQPEETP